jgi:predicted nucleic acid-binding protein
LASQVITLDTSAIIALTNADDPDHLRVSTQLLGESEPWLVPAGILGEMGYMLERLGPLVLDAFLEDLELGSYGLDCGPNDFARIRSLVERYGNLPLGFSDASVIACAERSGGRVLTIDNRHFGIIAREGSITVVPDDT